MSTLDYRKIQKVSCAGIEISTFLADGREQIIVSLSDIVEGLALDLDYAEVECFEYTMYDLNGKAEEHLCITHEFINDILWSHDASKNFEADLDDFRRYFAIEVITFWRRFEPAGGSLTVRESFQVALNHTLDRVDRLEIPVRRMYDLALTSLGYKKYIGRHELPTYQLGIVMQLELMYLGIVEKLLDNGEDMEEACYQAESVLAEPFKALGYISREL